MEVLSIFMEQLTFVKLIHYGNTEKGEWLLIDFIAELLKDFFVSFDLELGEVAKAVVNIKY